MGPDIKEENNLGSMHTTNTFNCHSTIAYVIIAYSNVTEGWTGPLAHLSLVVSSVVSGILFARFSMVDYIPTIWSFLLTSLAVEKRNEIHSRHSRLVLTRSNTSSFTFHVLLYLSRAGYNNRLEKSFENLLTMLEDRRWPVWSSYSSHRCPRRWLCATHLKKLKHNKIKINQKCNG